MCHQTLNPGASPSQGALFFISTTTVLGPISSSPNRCVTMASQLLPVSVTTGQKRPSESEPNPSERPEKQPRIETPTTSNEASCKNDIESKDADRLRRLRSVNRSVMSMFDGALKKDPGADLSTLLESYAQIYPGRRKKAEERALKGNLCLRMTPPFMYSP